MHISVGRAPDFKLTRRRQRFTHTATIDIWIDKNRLTEHRVIADFSLAMLCKNIRDILTRTTQKYVRHEIEMIDQQIILSIRCIGLYAFMAVVFKFPLGITVDQVAEIEGFIRDFFDFDKLYPIG